MRGANPTWAAYRQKAVAQLGTVGSGNHYVDLMRDEAGFVWIGVHFGSRGLGHTSATRYLKAAGGKDGMNVPPAVIDEDSEIGRRYIAAMQLAGRYSYAGREWVIERVRRIIGGDGHRHGSQPPQLRVAGEPRRQGFVGGAQGRNAGIPRPAWLRRRIDGRRRGDRRGRRQSTRRRLRSTRRSTARAGCSAARRPSGGSRAPRWTRGCNRAASRW